MPIHAMKLDRLFTSIIDHNGSALALSGGGKASAAHYAQVWSHRVLAGLKGQWQDPKRIAAGTQIEGVAAAFALDGRGLVAYADVTELYATLYQ